MSTPLTRQDVLQAAYSVLDVRMNEIIAVLNTPMPPAGLRDEFAKAALTGSLAHPNSHGSPRDHATWAFQVADAMLEARLK